MVSKIFAKIGLKNDTIITIIIVVLIYFAIKHNLFNNTLNTINVVLHQNNIPSTFRQNISSASSSVPEQTVQTKDMLNQNELKSDEMMVSLSRRFI